MDRFRMTYLCFSLMGCLGACASDYKALRPSTVDHQCIQTIKPGPLSTSWYKASIDVADRHIGGLLLIKNMGDSSYRVVFTGEAALKLLDLELRPGGFSVHHIIKALDRKAVIALLKKDFSLILGLPFHGSEWESWNDGDKIYYGVHSENDDHYLVADEKCRLLHVESGSSRKRKVSARFYGQNRQLPDSIAVQHHTFGMHIGLKRLNTD